MARDGSGGYDQPVADFVDGTTADADDVNTWLDDLGSEIANSIAKDGQTVITGTIDFNGNKLDLDVDADTSITADTDDVIDFEVGGADALKLGWQSVADTGFFTLDPGAFTADTTENTHRLAIKATNAVTIPTGTTALASSLYVVEPNLTATGTITAAATVYVKDAPTEGSSNYSLWVDAGEARFDGGADFQDGTLKRANLLDYGEVTNAIGSIGGGTQDIDLTLGNCVTATVDTSSTTFTFSNPTASDEGCGFVLVLTNGGSQTVTWPASVDWPAATAPTLTASGVDVLVFHTTDGGTTWRGNLVGAGYA